MQGINHSGSYRGTLKIMISIWPWLGINLTIIEIIKYLDKNNNMSIMADQIDMHSVDGVKFDVLRINSSRNLHDQQQGHHMQLLTENR